MRKNLSDPDPHVDRWKEKYPSCTRLEIAEVLGRLDDPEDIDTELRRRTARYLSSG